MSPATAEQEAAARTAASSGRHSDIMNLAGILLLRAAAMNEVDDETAMLRYEAEAACHLNDLAVPGARKRPPY